MQEKLIIMVIVLLVATSISAQLPPKGYFALYFDTGRTNWCYTGAGMVTFYVFVLPPQGGVDCMELMVPPPAGFSIFAEVYHADILQPVTGTLPTGLTACFNTCWYEWVRVASAALMIPNTNPAEVPIIALSGSPYPKILDCLSVESEAVAFTSLYTNYAECPPVGNRRSTWGAIKIMYE